MHSFLLYIVPSVPFTVTVFPSASRIVPSQERLLTVLSPVTIQLADAVPDDIALHFLIVRAKEAVRTVCSGLSPASFVVISGAAQEECIVIRVVNIHIGKYKGGFGIGRIEHSAVFCSQCSTVHLKGAVSDLGISGHALVQDHIPGAVILFVIAHVSGQIRVKQVQRIQALDADRL